MLPGEVSVGAVAFAGIEVHVLAVDVDDGDQVVELIHVEPLGEEDLLGAVGDEHGVGLHAGGAGHGDEELGELRGVAALALEDVIGAVEFAETVGLVLAGVMLAGVVSVFELLHGGVDGAQLLVLRGGAGDDLLGGVLQIGVGIGEGVDLLGPELSFGLPELVGVRAAM